MPRFTVEPSDYKLTSVDEAGTKYRLLQKSKFSSFDINVLGLGDVSLPSTPYDTIAAVFDLEGFTNFCGKIEPHLSVPSFLNSFLGWLMLQVREEMQQKEYEAGIALWAPLPFFVKFLGDGLLVLWDCQKLNAVSQRNIIVSMKVLTDKYRTRFLPTIKSRIVEPPQRLRCGIARGTVFSVGAGEDYVGSCINMAARLQKCPGITFCFNRRGFNLEDKTIAKFFTDQVVIKEVSVRGIGDHELVGILSSEYTKLSPKDKKFYRDV